MNKKLTFFLISVLLLSTFSTKAEKPRAKGYYVTLNGDTVEALVEIVVNLFNKKKVEESGFLFGITHVEKNKEIELGEGDIQAFGFTYLGQRYDFRYVKEIMAPGRIDKVFAKGTFLRLLAKGHCVLYFATSVDGRSDEYFFKRGEDDHYLTKNSTAFVPSDKDLAKFFADCPSLANNIKNKVYKDDDKYIKMVKFYNSSCRLKVEED